MTRVAASLGMIWGGRLRQRRLAAGLYQAQLAEQLGVSQQLVSQWEAGRVRLADEHRLALAKLFETTVAELFPYPDGNGGEAAA